MTARQSSCGHGLHCKPARNRAIFSLRNARSAGLPPAPAGWPHNEGIGTSDTRRMNCASNRASPTGKYRSVSDGMYSTGTVIERSARSTSPLNPGVRADVVALPGSRLQNHVVGIVVGEERPAPVFELLIERAIGRGDLPHLPAPPLLRVEPSEPDHPVGFDPFARRSGVVAAVERRIRRQRGNLPFEAHDAVRPRFRGARGGHDAIREVGIADGPLERLLGAHREADDRAHVRHLQLVDEQPMHRFDVVADGRHRKARAVKWLGRVAWRRRMAVAEQLGGDQEQLSRDRARGRAPISQS